MSESPNPTIRKLSPGRKNALIAVWCVSIVIGMVGLSYAAVPLYQMFCQVTGYGGTTRASVNSDGVPILDRDITIHFDANISKDLNWDFKPIQREVTIKLGEQKQIAYLAKNNTNETLTGTATYNVTPQSAGAYFNKIQCFCFTETTLKPGESLEMPVLFFVDPEMIDEVETKDIHTITLSYTFFKTEPAAKPVANLLNKDVEEKNNKL